MKNRYRDYYHDKDIVVRPRKYGAHPWWEAYLADKNGDPGEYLGRALTFRSGPDGNLGVLDVAHDRINEMDPNWIPTPII